jgi:hypothetical protein
MEEETKIESVVESTEELSQGEEIINKDPEIYVGPYLVKDIVENELEDHFTVNYFDETKVSETYHNDYKELIVTDKPIGMGELMQRKANVVTRPLLDIIRKYNYPINDMKFAVDVLNNIFKENEYRSYEKAMGSSPEKITMNDFDRILK